MKAAGKILIPILLLTVAGCATVVTKGQLAAVNAPIAAQGRKPKTLTLRVFVRTDNTMEDNASSTITMDPEFEAELKQQIEASGLYTVTQVARFAAEGLRFENLATDAAKRAMLPPEFKTDYFLDIYRYSLVNGYTNPYFVWTLVHVLTLGFVPVRLPVEADLRADLYDSNRHLVKKATATDSASIWSWSPLLVAPVGGINRFRSVKTATQAFQLNAVNTVLGSLARPD